jgi:hypothetical protein
VIWSSRWRGEARLTKLYQPPVDLCDLADQRSLAFAQKIVLGHGFDSSMV